MRSSPGSLCRAIAVAIAGASLAACHTYQPAALASLRSGQQVRFESRAAGSALRFGPIPTDAIDDHCQATRVSGVVATPHSSTVISLRALGKTRGGDRADSSCAQLAGQAVNVVIRDTAAVRVKRQRIAWGRSILLVLGGVIMLQGALLGASTGSLLAGPG
ncbi:MAG: hypothetical protein K2R93_09005 [Gemmatimonadaceae bacterium]|nr:hypothetical protein [Gemmatimonadaceae bacterium]